MDTKITSVTATLIGLRPLLFDRYAGDNKTKLSVMDKLYVNEEKECGIPILNLFSMLTAQNTPSVAKRFYGKQGREVALGIQSFVNIESVDSDPMFCVVRDAKGEAYKIGDKRIKTENHVARLKDGIPNPKERPVLPKDWRIKVKFGYQENQMVSLSTMQKMVEEGGVLGLGTFRPIYGRYEVKWDDAKKS